MRALLLSCAILALAACHKAESGNESSTAAQAPVGKGVDRSHKGKPEPDASFDDPDGSATSLAEFGGKPLLVNLWATWCAPCVKELPTLDRLAQSKSAGDLQVLAVSQDSGPHASVEAFLATHQVKKLDAYQDAKMNLSGGLDAEVLPTTILFDAQGREIWRYVGDLDWTGPEAARLLAEVKPVSPSTAR